MAGTHRHRAAEFARYLGGGALCALLNNLVVIGGDLFGLHYLAGLVLALLLVTPVGYLYQSLVTFRARPGWRPFAGFASSVLVGFALSVLLMALLCSGAGLPVAVASPLVTLALLAWNYGWARRVILRPA